jgi:hypothetical protein
VEDYGAILVEQNAVFGVPGDRPGEHLCLDIPAGLGQSFWGKSVVDPDHVRVVDVDHPALDPLAYLGRQDLHVPGEDDQLGPVVVNDAQQPRLGVRLDLVQQSRPVCQALAKTVGETVNIAVLSGRDALYRLPAGQRGRRIPVAAAAADH